MGPVPGDCGEGVHFLTVADSRITHDTVSGNSGGILLTDEVGPTHNNLIAYNTVSDNTTDCGITVPGHNPNALNSQGVPQPSVAGVYDNAIIGNKVIDNGLLGDGAGVLFANASAGTASYDNLVAHNYISGNGLSGVTMHAHTIAPGQFEDLSGNAIIDNVIGPNNLDGDPLDGTVKDDRTTGVLVFSGGTPVQVTVAYNQIFSNHFGIWTSKVVSSTGLRTNSFRHVIAPLSLDH